MSVVEIAGDGRSELPPASRESRNARFGLHWPTPQCAVVSADGEIDAANACTLGDYTVRIALLSQYLVLDLSGVEFFGTEGFSMLHMLNARCVKAGVPWAMVPSAAVTRVLRICDPEGGLVAASTVDAAVIATQGEPRRLLQLVIG